MDWMNEGEALRLITLGLVSVGADREEAPVLAKDLLASYLAGEVSTLIARDIPEDQVRHAILSKLKGDVWVS